MLLAAGNGLEAIRVWDVNSELCVLDQPLLRSGVSNPTYVTSLAVSDAGKVVHAGCRDGAVRSYDLRLKNSQSLISYFHEHKSSIIKCHRPTSNPTLIYTGSASGRVLVSDVRFKKRSVHGLTTWSARNSKIRPPVAAW